MQLPRKASHTPSNQANFKEKVFLSFLAADIPLHKLNHLSLKPWFAALEKSFFSETFARASKTQLAFPPKRDYSRSTSGQKKV